VLVLGADVLVLGAYVLVLTSPTRRLQLASIPTRLAWTLAQ
jgi:hypothetical protein